MNTTLSDSTGVGQPESSATQPVHAVTCMEIWGGNTALDNAISTPGIDAWVVSQPYKGQAAGGDIHYVSMCASGRIARFVVADVSGHGDEVSRTAKVLRDLMRHNMNTLDQTKFARALNDAFQMGGRADGRFATALLASYFSPTDQLVLCNAGHPRPMWYRADRGEWSALHHAAEGSLTEASDLPLGIIEPTTYRQFSVKLSRGDLVLVMTDGLLEARSPSGAMLGEAGLLAMLREIDVSSPQDIARALMRRVEEYRGGMPADDDLTLVLLHHNGGNPPVYSVGTYVKAIAKMMGILPV